jgi:hypothetical protein
VTVVVGLSDVYCLHNSAACKLNMSASAYSVSLMTSDGQPLAMELEFFGDQFGFDARYDVVAGVPQGPVFIVAEMITMEGKQLSIGVPQASDTLPSGEQRRMLQNPEDNTPATGDSEFDDEGDEGGSEHDDQHSDHDDHDFRNSALAQIEHRERLDLAHNYLTRDEVTHEWTYGALDTPRDSNCAPEGAPHCVFPGAVQPQLCCTHGAYVLRSHRAQTPCGNLRHRAACGGQPTVTQQIRPLAILGRIFAVLVGGRIRWMHR